MSLEITKICRTCLALEGALLSIYDSKGSGGHGCVADMLGYLTSISLKKSDGMPEKVCIACISEINRCYSFKMRCDNSDRTLRQLLNITEEQEEPKYQQEDVKLLITGVSTLSQPADEKKKPQKRKADTSLAELREEAEQETLVGDANDIYSVQAEDDLGGSYFVIRAAEEESEVGEDKQDSHMAVYEELLHKFVSQPEENEEQAVIEEVDDSETYKPTVRRVPARKKQELKCQSCPMTFVHPKNLAKHLSKHHSLQETPLTKEQTPVAIQKSEAEETEVQSESAAPQAAEEPEDFEVEFQTIEETEESNPAEYPNLLTEMVEVNIKHRCPYCGAGFAQQKSLNIHIKQSKCTEKQYSCTKCQKVFISAESLSAHVQTHNDEFACDICTERLTTERELNEHKAEKHNFNTKNMCPVCKKVFSMLSTLKDHMRIHSGERPFLCSLCGKGFSQNANLKQHVMRHKKLKPFKCDQCSRSFVSKGELYSHLRSHTGDQPFVCNICKTAFTTSSSLVKHKRIHTGERPYACDFCPMRFTALNTLKNHRRTHTGEKPYRCKFCDRGFAQKSDCAIHLRTHTGERRYVCQICGSAFHQSGTLRTHMKTHNREKADVEEEDRPSSVVDLVDGEELEEEDQSQEQMNDQKKASTSMEAVAVEMGEDDLLNFAIEECSSENNDFSGE